MSNQYCPAFGPGSKVCPRSICDCFIEEFPDDMAQAGALHPEFFAVSPVWHDEPERWERTGRLDEGPCQCSRCLSSQDGTP